ncbi:MAG: 50S ribosomal protein P1 [Candidatus Thorarchaeota archaeon]|nr:MAG: 50S ribosomal protein P1 [Candidatus Thorarchaeota archaeon]RLI61566.1 MAG: 50S ribosomal protein P1 [Candidatus Thorarchaeota archaeon]
MEYVYSALLLHKAGQEINEKNMEAVLTAAGVKADKGRIKALLAALEGVDIDEALKSAAAMPVAAAPAAGAGAAEAAPAAEEEKKEEEEEKEEEFTAGLGSLFG